MQPNTNRPAAAPPPADSAPPSAGEPLAPGLWPIAPIVQQATATFRRDLPELMQTHYRQWVAYHGDRRLGFGRSKFRLLQEWSRRGLPENDIVVRRVEPEPPDDDERVV